MSQDKRIYKLDSPEEQTAFYPFDEGKVGETLAKFRHAEPTDMVGSGPFIEEVAMSLNEFNEQVKQLTDEERAYYSKKFEEIINNKDNT